ncbi:universal stress protein [Roseimaritima ulvae]|uniref:Universal stress protein n=1 Tax=Roseimaritima ulvae TaxID=980254 RepID=A0A5B9QYD7_9BACT|nr:universal stress protein [Roseimaritima ulvae]QEG42146.1 Universal stress protein [Roseimaritima ulvae]
MKNIVLAYDGSSFADEAAAMFAHLPHNERIKLTVLTILEIPLVSGDYSTAAWVADAAARERQLAQEKFVKVEQMFDGANVDLEHHIAEGHAGRTIVEVAADRGADLVVVGARGHSTISRMLLGSTSDYVATHASCSVLVVRPTGLLESKRALRIAIGYNDSPPAQAALEDLLEICQGKDTEVRVLSVACYVLGFYDEMVPDPESIKQEATQAMQRAVEKLKAVNPSTRGVLLEKPHIGDGLVTSTEDIHTDILVIGETPHSAIARLILGSVSRYVLRHATCSVWITRNRALANS